ncbi:MAG: hypothetical protein IJ654_00920, partial [Bacteroidales bacterium]|nr:hypothetical protein [Bacteroidales bacterium]
NSDKCQTQCGDIATFSEKILRPQIAPTAVWGLDSSPDRQNQSVKHRKIQIFLYSANILQEIFLTDKFRFIDYKISGFHLSRQINSP